ncbi:hypothetical protein [Peptostreptococcus faecalis]|nr:hypothetical protein [Peptostreptococcus faecalis]
MLPSEIFKILKERGKEYIFLCASAELQSEREERDRKEAERKMK